MILLIIGAVFMLAISIIIHELGHLLCGKMVGVSARIFSIGYGRGIWKKRIGKTIYQVTAFPLGGYVQFKGDNYFKQRKGRQDELLSIHPLKRIIPVIGGPLFNLIFGFIIFFFLGLSGDSMPGNRIFIEDAATEYSPAYKAGLRTNDTIVSIDGNKTDSFEDIIAAVALSKGDALEINVLRDGVHKIFKVNPDITGSRPEIGITPAGERRVVVTFTYMEQLRHWLTGILDDQNESEKYFNDKIGNNNELSELQKQEYLNNNKKSELKTRAIDFLRDGDVILAVEGKDVYTIPDLQRELGKHQKQIVEIRVERKQYPLLTPWSREIAVAKVPVKPANIITFSGLSDESGYRTEPFSIADFDPEMSSRLENIKINHKKFNNFPSLLKYIQSQKGSIELAVGNLNFKANFTVRPIGLLGFRPSLKFEPEPVQREITFLSALSYAFDTVYRNVANSMKAFSMLLGGWLAPSQSLSGPVGIFEAAGISLEYGWYTYFDFIGKISIALMFMNLLPLPLVDGGHILLYLIEAVAGRPVPPKVIELIFRFGFLFLIGVAIFVTYHDIMRIVR